MNKRKIFNYASACAICMAAGFLFDVLCICDSFVIQKPSVPLEDLKVHMVFALGFIQLLVFSQCVCLLD